MLQQATANPVYLTAQGRARLEAELFDLITVRRPQLGALVGATAEEGNLAENTAYQQAKDEQALLEGRIGLLRDCLAHAVLIEQRAGSVVALGCTVTIEDGGEEDTYTIVGPLEAAPAQGRISHESPVGRALLGHAAGDEVWVEVPAGARVVTIRAVA